MKKVLSWVAFILGFVLIVCGWLLWGNHDNMEVLILNIVISMLVYGLSFSDLLIPWVKRGDKSQSRLGNMGLKWTVIGLYSIAAIVIIIVSLTSELSFEVQLLLHGVAIVALIAGFAMVLGGSKNIEKVHKEEEAVRAGVEGMRRAAKALYNDAMDNGTVPAELTARLSKLVEELRFVAPSNSSSAVELEESFVKIANSMRDIILFSMGDENLATELSKLERTLKERKSEYSN